MTTETIHHLPRHLIVAGQNDRTVFNDTALRDLTESIKRDGLIQPITVRKVERPPYAYEIVAGERRFRAASLLAWETVPCIVRELDDEQASRIMLAENIQRADIDPLDEASAYDKRMKQFGWSVSECAKAAKVSSKRVAARLLLLTLIPEAQQLIRAGQFGPQFGECLAPLDANRQRIALKAYSSSERQMLLREFQAVVAKLLEEQTQDSLFDLNLVAQQALEEHRADHAAWRTRKFPSDASLPLMKKNGTVGLSFETYITELLNSPDPHHRAAAPVVGRVYQALLSAGMCYPPRRERNSPLESQP